MENTAMIKITINYNNKSFPTLAHPNTPLNTFLLNVLQSFKLNPSQCNLKHQKTPILITDSRPISVLLKGKSYSLVFSLALNNNNQPQLSSIASPVKKTSSTASAQSTVIRIENASNYQLVSSLINTFIASNQLTQCTFAREYNSSIIRFTVPNSSIAFEFIQYLSQMKMSNNQLKNVKASIEPQQQPIQSNNQMRPQLIQPKTANNSLIGSRSVTLPSIRNERYANVNTINNTHGNNSNYNTISPEMDRSNKKMIMNFYSKQEYVRNSSPYVEEEEKRILEYQRNKKKWLINEGFYTSAGAHTKKSYHIIPNYVNLTPSESPLNHRFRDINKNNWVDKKGFFVC